MFCNKSLQISFDTFTDVKSPALQLNVGKNCFQYMYQINDCSANIKTGQDPRCREKTEINEILRPQSLSCSSLFTQTNSFNCRKRENLFYGSEKQNFVLTKP